jgi:hypothetical protein
MLVTLGGTDPQRAWDAVSASLRGGDLVVAHVTPGASLQDQSWSTFGDRVRADRPLVAFVLAIDDPSALTAMVAQGVPASASAVGYGTPDGWDAATLAAMSTAIRSLGKRTFVTAYAGGGAAGFDEIGLHADLVELRPRSADPVGLAAEIAPAVRAIRAAGQPLIYVTIPGALAGATDSIGAASAAIDARVAGVGLALPASTPAEVVVGLRGAR